MAVGLPAVIVLGVLLVAGMIVSGPISWSVFSAACLLVVIGGVGLFYDMPPPKVVQASSEPATLLPVQGTSANNLPQSVSVTKRYDAKIDLKSNASGSAVSSAPLYSPTLRHSLFATHHA